MLEARENETALRKLSGIAQLRTLERTLAMELQKKLIRCSYTSNFGDSSSEQQQNIMF